MPDRNKPRLKITSPALADIEDIAAYPVSQWGEAQARTYLARIDQTILAIADQPESGTPRFGVPAAIRGRKAGSHVVFYRLEGHATLYILRILHERMDHGRHLGSEGSVG
ncbi:type II toxin-antitoxin system RelE/ParE family toxin [Novosphingobium sp.]|uniref:type II toxin-antitoxin system RelE/ParE family toxin n=1 Tax=Novosphingobium sp. TaxID=1874826 RepID=UPI00261E4119|nr:type II toxin-antitoxin system RelE/ParE family toxin [Novosphingobium sp.]